jgi:hypothetical protein
MMERIYAIKKVMPKASDRMERNKENKMKRFVLVLTLGLIVPSLLCADIYLKSVERTKPFEMMGKEVPEKVEIREQWLAKDKFAHFGKEISIIANYESKKLYFIINKAKIYYELPLDINRADLLKMLPPKAAAVVESIKITNAKVNLNVGAKKVANWNSRGNELEMVLMIPAMNIMPKFKIKFWTTKELPFDYTQYKMGFNEIYEKFMFNVLSVDEESKKEMQKLYKMDGFGIATEIIVEAFGSVIHVEGQTLELEEKPAPAGTYSVPKGFKKKTISPSD